VLIVLSIGRPIEEIETPALLLDLDKFQWNIEKMFEFARKAKVNVRPHSKTFKAAAICNRLLEAGAVGLMAQKLGEAEALLHAGVLYGDKNMLVGQEFADPAKVERVVGLNVAMGEGKVLTSIENAEEAELLSEAALRWGVKQHVIIEMTHGRCGTEPNIPTVDLAKKVVSLKGLEFRGIYGYEGPVEREVALQRNKVTVETANMIRVYFKSSLSVLTQIIGGNFPNRVVTDAGQKVMSSGFGPPLVRMDGEIIECERVVLSEEHGTVYFKEGSEVRKRLKWGQKIEFIPSHCCTTVNQHDNIFVVKNGRLAAVWPITARGRYY